MHYFFQSDLDSNSTHITLQEEEAHHLKNVLRLTTGQHIKLLNGKGLIAEARIVEVHKKQVLLQLEHQEHLPLPAYHLHIAIAPTKNTDRLAFFLEKATEIGVHEITFLNTHYTERVHLNYERLEKVLISACKQSLNAYKPILNQLTSFEVFVKEQEASTAIKGIAHCYSGSKTNILQLEPNPSYTIGIGPEGDFSEEEVALAQQNNFQAITLGTSRLRTETAGIVACSQIAQKLL